ncbi:MAG: ATP-binding cassette domain-containing protein, partial [Clostridia bacterium]
MIEFVGVTKQYLYGARVLGAVDMKIEDGEIIAVVGGEQSGKTSFLKVLTGVTDCEGQVLFDGNPVKTKTDDVIMQFDDLALFKHKTVYNNLAYPLKLRKFDTAEIDCRVRRVADMLGITACLFSQAGKISLLDQKRMALARLFIRDARLLVLDNPTFGLTRDDAAALWADLAPLLLDVSKKGVTVVYSTSNIGEAISISDRIVALHAGEVKQIGAYAKIYSTPSSGFAADCVDSAYNLQKAVLSHENGVLTLCFDKNGKQTKLNASCFENKILNSYIGKTVLVGCHADGFINEASLIDSDVNYLIKASEAPLIDGDVNYPIKASETKITNEA